MIMTRQEQKFFKVLISLNALSNSFQQFILLILIGNGLTQCSQDNTQDYLDFWTKLRMKKSRAHLAHSYILLYIAYVSTIRVGHAI